MCTPRWVSRASIRWARLSSSSAATATGALLRAALQPAAFHWLAAHPSASMDATPWRSWVFELPVQAARKDDVAITWRSAGVVSRAAALSVFAALTSHKLLHLSEHSQQHHGRGLLQMDLIAAIRSGVHEASAAPPSFPILQHLTAIFLASKTRLESCAVRTGSCRWTWQRPSAAAGRIPRLHRRPRRPARVADRCRSQM